MSGEGENFLWRVEFAVVTPRLKKKKRRLKCNTKMGLKKEENLKGSGLPFL
jgi:hypothetical protein